MGLKTYNPTSPGRRQLDHDRPVGAVEGQAGQVADRRPEQVGRPQQPRPHHRAAIAAAGTSARTAWSTSSASSSTRSAPSSGWNTIPTAPPSSRWSSTRTASRPTSSRRSACGRRQGRLLEQTVDVKPGNAMPLERMPVGTIVHNVEMKPRKGGQIARSAGAYAQYVGRDAGLGDPSPQLGRAAPGPRHLPRHGRRGVQPGPRQHLDRQGRPQPLARHASRSTAASP